MRQEKFTPGPWETLTAQKGYPYEPTKEDFLRYCSDCWDDSVNVYDGSDGWGVVRSEMIGAVICVFGNGPTTGPNANLIAAGPDMYEALLASVKTINRLNDELASRDGWGDRDWDSVDSECMAYKETLAKARGESQ